MASLLLDIPLAIVSDLYRSLYLIRRTEEKIVEHYGEQEMRCPVHLSIGQEAIAVGVCTALRQEDVIFGTHRCHAHYLAKGGDPALLFAELCGKETGCASGKAGSMHLVDVAQGMWGASAIVGGSIPLGVGVALSAQMTRSGKVAAVFFGDGATEQGVFYESLNFASLKKLPVLFVCENNFYATYTPFARRQARDNIFERGESFGVPGCRVDGSDVLEVFRAAQKAVLQARHGGGPTLLECQTYRWKDHVGPGCDHELGYRSGADLQFWREKCPVKRLRGSLVEQGLDPCVVEGWEKGIDFRIQNSWEFAKESPFPVNSSLFQGVF
ncbi:MAG: thiamine pyrophosphate-dependent dehydrogenase E1 component subunit alpha [Deltaproteobacteria bacterium]|nr:thiamine pyrophosphate-dependent dehydrogenase E1 component subunit alpha [Deltaproteobacteria bacterium]